MKVSRNKIIIAVIGTLLVAGAVAVSQTADNSSGTSGHQFRYGDHMLRFYTRALDLTDAQQAQVKQILDKESPTIQPLCEQMKQGHEQMRQLEQSATFDEGKVRALASQQSELMTELTVQKARTKNELYQLLTPDQKAKMSKLAEHKGHFRHWSHDGPPAS